MRRCDQYSSSISDFFMAVAPINSVVYPVSGGMEDWLYAAGWDRSELSTCDGGDIDIIDARTTHLRRAEDPTTSRKGPLAAASQKSLRTSSSTRGKKKSSKAYAGRSKGAYTKQFPPDIDGSSSRDGSSSSIRGRALAGRSSNASSAYDDPSENRAVVFLVETSDLKVPAASSLGGSKEVTVLYISLLIDLMIISIIIMIMHTASEC